MSTKARRRKRSGTKTHGGLGEGPPGDTGAVGDVELTDLIPDVPTSYARTTAVSLTFVEGGGSKDTITRAGDSFVVDGWIAGMKIRVRDVAATAANHGKVFTLFSVVALTLTLIAADDVAAETDVVDLLGQGTTVPGDNPNQNPTL